jgi:CcmD family protein
MEKLMSGFRINKRRLAVGFIGLLVWAAPLFAQQPPTPDGFVPMSELANREVLPATPLVFYAYGFVWVALMVYVWSIWRRLMRVEQDLDAVRKRLETQR